MIPLGRESVGEASRLGAKYWGLFILGDFLKKKLSFQDAASNPSNEIIIFAYLTS